ncbi:hypothetical protein BOW52_10770 [Solemya elarraichensis gill symbiont]|uniref:Uncharacterized protein n=1 Tax=Solemya elarraichensis gill symbiont TaxID=1918949 RepID=A0A1T2KUE7_9GAMM|nr:hypothetical protein BOW52_10770 [Solemya elarraichensis gill symbiont]
MATYVLSSTDSKTRYPENESHDFRVYLSKPLDLRGEWTISLLEFSVASGKLPSEFYVYCNLCDDSVVGETELPLLRRVCMKRAGTEIYSLPYAVPVKLGHATEVHVYIKDRDGAPASFLGGKVTVTLALKKR